MKRFDTADQALRQAQRTMDPVSGDLIDTTQHNLLLVSDVDWPVLPALRRALELLFSAKADPPDITLPDPP